MVEKTETQKMLIELDNMLKFLNADKENTFERLRLQTNQKLNDAEALLFEKEKLESSDDPKKIYEKRKLENQIEGILDDVNQRLKELEKELKSQKNKAKLYDNLVNKENILKLMKERYHFLKNKLDGLSIENEKFQNNKTNLEQLDLIMEKNKKKNYEEREIYEVEEKAIKEFKQRVKKQDNDLEDIKIGIKEIKNEAIRVRDNIRKVGEGIEGTGKHVDTTNTHIKSQNEKLKDLLNKFRKSDKICCDIILILIIIGLIMVLYRIIKKKV